MAFGKLVHVSKEFEANYREASWYKLLHLFLCFLCSYNKIASQLDLLQLSRILFYQVLWNIELKYYKTMQSL